VLCYAALGAVLGILLDYVHSLGGEAVLVGLAVGAPALTGAAGRPFGVWKITLRPGLGLMLVNFGYVALLSFGAAAVTEQHAGVAALVIPVFGIGVIASRTILAGVADRSLRS